MESSPPEIGDVKLSVFCLLPLPIDFVAQNPLASPRTIWLALKQLWLAIRPLWLALRLLWTDEQNFSPFYGTLSPYKIYCPATLLGLHNIKRAEEGNR